MDTVFQLGDVAVTVADVAHFLVEWVLPPAIGLAASLYAEWFKQKLTVPPAVRRYVIRGVIALVCVGLNALAALTAGTFDGSTLASMFVSYFAAAATYDHLIREA